MSSLPSPWSGLAPFAPRVDLWPVIQALGGGGAAGSASPEAWVRAGLHTRLVPHLSAPAVAGTWIWPGSSGWPAALEDLPFGPVALAVEGGLEMLVAQGAPGVAIVGARSCTPYGLDWAARLGSAVGRAGGVVVSGLARGIDTAAHESALDRTIAVLGQGLDAPMAAWQGRLRQRILRAGGSVVSEFPGATPASEIGRAHV